MVPQTPQKECGAKVEKSSEPEGGGVRCVAMTAFRYAPASFGITLSASPLPASAQAVSAPSDSAAANDAVQQLLMVLQDDTARAALIAQLQSQTNAVTEAGSETNLARGFVDVTSAAFGTVGTEVRAIWREMSRLVSGDLNTQLASILTLPEWLLLAVSIAATILTVLLLQRVVRPLIARLNPKTGAGAFRRIWATLIATALRIAAVAGAWAFGMVLAGTVLSGGETLFLLQSLYLNAFAAFGIARAALAAVASPDARHQPSLIAGHATIQHAVYAGLRPVLGIVMQGYLFVLPALQATAGFTTVRPVRTLVATLAALVAVWAIRHILRASREERPAEQVEGEGNAVAQGMSLAWARIWPPLALLAVGYSWVTALTRPAFAAEIVLGGVVFSALAVLLLIVALRLSKGASGWKPPLPRSLTWSLPELAPRFSAIGGVLGWILAALLGVGALAAVLHGWGAIDIGDIAANATAQVFVWRVASALLVLSAAAVIWAIVASVIDRNLRLELDGTNQAARRRTLLGLFRNAFTIAIGIVTIMVALSQLGLDIAPLLAGAGVIGLAIGFGSQKLVQDIITGIFIQFEGALNDGDVVTVAGISGGVEKVTLRSIRLRSLDGALHVIPFSSVDTVSNLTRDFSYHVAEIGVAYKEKVPLVKEAMSAAFDRLKAEDIDGAILEPLEMQGVISLGDSAVVLRARIKTRPAKQWAIGRRYNELVKDVMDERGIEIPFPHRQIVVQGLPQGLVNAMNTPDPKPAT